MARNLRNSSATPDSSGTRKLVHDALLQAPDNLLSDLAWKVYVDLTQAASPAQLTLSANYIGQIGMLLSAADWANNPQTITDLFSRFGL